MNTDILQNLTDEEREMVKILSQVVDIVGEIFAKEQNNPDFRGANFYPHDITREEFDQAAIRDPELSRFDTIVERTSASVYRAVPYSVKYQKYYKRIIPLLQKAKDLCEDSSFRVYLSSLILCLEEGSLAAYRQMMVAWMNTKNYEINFPFTYDERYMDDLLGLKGSYNAAVFVEDEKLTAGIQKPLSIQDGFVDTLSLPGTPVVYPRLSAAVYRTVNHKGMMADMNLRAWNVPDDSEARLEAGSRQIMIRKTIMDLFKNELKPMADVLFAPDNEGFSEDELQAGIFWAVTLHEMCHNVAHYQRQKGQEKYAVILEELKSYVLPIPWLFSCKQENICSPAEVKAGLLGNYSLSLSGLAMAEKIKTRESYAQATLVHFNYLQDHGAIEITGREIKTNFDKIVSVNLDLFHEIVQIIERGNYDRARKFVETYNKRDRFHDILKELRKVVHV